MVESHTRGRSPAATGRGASELARRIELQIAGSARGRIRDLRVTCQDNVIVLQGRSKTHHDKQVAQEAALTLTNGHSALTNRITVGT